MERGPIDPDEGAWSGTRSGIEVRHGERNGVTPCRARRGGWWDATSVPMRSMDRDQVKPDKERPDKGIGSTPNWGDGPT